MASSSRGLHLRGEVTPFGGQPSHIEFQIQLALQRPTGGPVTGAAQFSTGGAEAEPIPVSGTWSARQITLRQVELTRTGWISGRPGDKHTFVLNFPPDVTSEVITGQWTNGPFNTGKLTLKIAPEL